MSLIYDALHRQPSAAKPSPNYGSVSGGRGAHARRDRRALRTSAAVVVIAGSIAVIVSSVQQPHPVAPHPVVAAPVSNQTADTLVSIIEPTQAPAEAPASGQRAIKRDASPAGQAPARTPAGPDAAVAPASRLSEEVSPVSLPPSRPAAPTRAEQSVRNIEQRPAERLAAQATDGKTPENQRTSPNLSAQPSNSRPVVEQTVVDIGDGLTRFNSLVGRGDFSAAEALLEDLRSRGLNDLALSRMSGFLALRAGKLDDAREAYERVLAQFPNDREASLNLSLVDLRQGFTGEAELRLRRIAELRPDDAQVRNLLSQVRAQGRAQ